MDDATEDCEAEQQAWTFIMISDATVLSIDSVFYSMTSSRAEIETGVCA